jgi:hypothetical protein
MTTAKTFLVLIHCFCLAALALVNFDTLSPNTWAQIPTTGQYPTYAVETHLAWDTSGYAYMLGSCAYGGAAGGTHNNDIFRYQISTGASVKVFTCGTDPWGGGCQAGQIFDPTRNCIWFGPGANAVCSNGVLWFPGVQYYGGLYRMQCPGGPIVKIRDAGISGHYFVYDAVNDLVIGVTMDPSYYGCRLYVYNVKRDSIYEKTAPAPLANIVTDQYHYTCCFDSKRGLIVVAQMAGLNDLWFYNTTTQVWSHKTPNMNPTPRNVPLAYDPLLDKYVLFGTDAAGQAGTADWHPQIWVYDYDANTWTQRSRGNMHYDTLGHPENSTWPCTRTYPGCFGFSPKDRVMMNWGGYPTEGSTPVAGNKDASKMNIWAFKLGAQGTGIQAQRPQAPASPVVSSLLSAFPNPFKASVMFTLSGFMENGAALRIFDASGKQVADLSAATGAGHAVWNPGKRPAGVYIVRAQKGDLSLIKRIILTD